MTWKNFKTRFSWHESDEFFFEFVKSVDENNSQSLAGTSRFG